MPTISILIQNDIEKIICSFSCVDVILHDMNIVGEGYIGVAQSLFTVENTNLLSKFVSENKTIKGYESKYPLSRQYGFLFDEHFEVYNGEKCLPDYGYYAGKNLLVIGNRVKSERLLLRLFNDIKSCDGGLTHRVMKSLLKNKIIGFDSRCEEYGLTSSSISFMVYNHKGDNIYGEYYVGKDIDPIDYLNSVLVWDGYQKL